MGRSAACIALVLTVLWNAACTLLVDTGELSSTKLSSGDAGDDPPDRCAEGETRSSRCSDNDEGEHVQRCVFGVWVDDVTCIRPSECIDGATQYVRCEGKPNLVRTRTCLGSAWHDDPCFAVPLSAGWYHTCAIRKTGEVVCWGLGADGRLGNGSAVSSTLPVPISDFEEATAISAGGAHSCAVRPSGTVACWGYGAYGCLGNGADQSVSVPSNVLDLSGAVAISATYERACALGVDKTVSCWGGGYYGAIGDGTTEDRWEAVKVSSLPSDIIAVTTGAFHSCALREGGQVWCWGSNFDGQMGSDVAWSSVPVLVSNLSDAVAISARWAHMCAVRRGGNVVCWGYGEDGALGRGNRESSNVPSPVVALTDAISISVGDRHSCAVRAGGTVVCWGRNHGGQLGNGSTEEDSPSPVTVVGIEDAVAVEAGGYHSCALRSSGAIVCWGEGGDGQLGNGKFSNSNIPVAVEGL